MVPESKTLSRFSGSSEDIFIKFESFVADLERLYGCSLSRPQLNTLKELSTFCSSLVEGDISHPWRSEIRNLGSQSRFGLTHSLFLFRKVIPKEKPLVGGYVDKLGSTQEPPDADFTNFAVKLTRQIFRFGWDRTYQDACLLSSLPTTSCAECGRRAGGCRELGRMEFTTRSEFCEYVLKSVVPKQRGASRVQAIETGGKWRIIAVPPRVDNALRPLHKAMYSHLSKFGWLLRGDAKPNRFKDFVPVDGEVFVSGDYESATDNLNSELQRIILRELLNRAYTVPDGIKEHAIDTYSSVLESEGRQVVQRRGQLMGQLTSFPLLCLVNYITFRYSIPRDVPVRINGDDIVFRATPEEVSLWENNVAKGGLTLSKGKTLIHRRGFTLNSTPFWSRASGAKLVGFVRPSALFPKGSLVEQIKSLNGRFYSACAGFGARRREVVRRSFLIQNQKAIFSSRRSVTRGLGLAVGEGLLKDLGLWYRELFYCEQLEERRLPNLVRSQIPQGWVQVSSSWLPKESVESWKRAFHFALSYHAWTEPFIPSDADDDAYFQALREGALPYGLGRLIAPRVRRMLRMSRAQVWKWVNCRRNPSAFGRVGRVRGPSCWVQKDLLAPRSQVEFVNGGLEQ